jgi:uncharacterized protein (DUF2147 family)
MKNSIIHSLIVSILLLANSAIASTSIGPDDIVGVWKTGEGTAMVRIYKNGDKYQGKVVWLKEPIDPETGKPKVDKNHPDEASRKRAVLGLINIWGFLYKDNNTLNTRIENLLEANLSQVFYRKNKYSHNKTGYRGVCFCKRTKP